MPNYGRSLWLSCHFTRATKSLLWVGRSKMEEEIYYNHKKSFNHKRYSRATTLSSCVWHLKENLDVTLNLKWSVMRCATHYSNMFKKMSFVFVWKLVIFVYPKQPELKVLNKTPNKALNKQLEVFCKCRHENKYLSKNFRVNEKR